MLNQRPLDLLVFSLSAEEVEEPTLAKPGLEELSQPCRDCLAEEDFDLNGNNLLLSKRKRRTATI